MTAAWALAAFNRAADSIRGQEEFVAAIAGAVVGGFISLAAQAYSFMEQDKRSAHLRALEEAAADERRLERESLIAFSILTKINRALTALTQIREHLNVGFRRCVQNRMDLLHGIRPISSDPDRISFDLEEFALVRELDRPELLQELIDLPYVLDGYIENMRLFRELRWGLTEKVSGGDVRPDGRAWTTFAGPDAIVAKLRTHEGNVLLRGMFCSMIVQYPPVVTLFYELNQAFHKRLGRTRMRIDWEIEPWPNVPKRRR